MTVHDHAEKLIAGIFDVDGVLLASPHERAWREALQDFAEPDRFTTAIYQAHVAGKPRLEGARAALEALGVQNAERQTVAYAERKQKRLEELIQAGSVAAFPDALRFVQALGALGWSMAVASSSKNANQMMQAIHLDSARSLLDAFCANVCGRALGRANRTRKFSCSLPRNCKWRQRTASWSRTRPPASRRHARAA
jgi:beta-phosphoglucomutase